MANRTLVNTVWAGSIITAVLIVNNTLAMQEKISSTVERQSQVNNSLNIHINTFQALESSSTGWADNLEHVKDAKDMLGLYELLDIEKFGLNTSLDNFRLVSSRPHTVNGTDIGVIEVCVDSGNNVLEVTSDSYKALIEGLSSLEASREYYFDFVNVLGGSDIPQAEVGDLCVLLRADDVEGETL